MENVQSLLGSDRQPDTRTYWGKISADGLARALVAHFNTPTSRAQMTGDGTRILVQITNRQVEHSDPTTALTVGIVQDSDSITVTMGRQKWIGIAADLARTGIMALINPSYLLNELDNVARNVDWLSLRDQVWAVIDQYCQSVGGSLGIPEELKQVACPYCGVGNPIGQPKCSACGAPLGEYQPITCPKCGYLVPWSKRFCTRCGASLTGDKPARPRPKRSSLI
ncbi:MAG: zinc ribbon domain-containing protein [Anaerolineae bacterium]|nr:zinc ribbon domain-containing protein [Anaerolineae bacterium]